MFSWGPDGVTLRDSEELTDDEASVVSEVSQTTTENGGSIKAKLLDKIKALELLGKHLGMFTDKMNISGDPDAPVRHEFIMTPSLKELMDKAAGKK